MAERLSKGNFQVFPTEDMSSLCSQLNDVFWRLRNELDEIQGLRGAHIDEYEIENAETTREFDADSTTVAELADIVATLIEDLKESYGIY